MKQSTMKWDEGQIFPTFTYKGATLDAVESSSMNRDELLAYATLQGIVNRSEIRMLLLDMHSDQGGDTWPTTAGLSYVRSDFLSVFKKYYTEADGVVLFSLEKSHHYLNLACTAASTRNAIPMTEGLYNRLMGEGLLMPVVEDLTTFTMTDPKEIYTYAYEKYWQKNTHRLLVSQNPHEVFHLRDVIAAAGCAVLFTENRRDEDRAVYERFLADMEPGKAICMGWYTEERSGITTATSFGLSTVPGDLFCNYTVYAQDKPIHYRPEVDLPALENKIYCAPFISDGDNVQYIQRFMRKYWDNYRDSRGKSCINWTVSPSLVDIAPDILNYYYDTATDKDCFVSGPSGLGYAMAVNTLAEEIEAKNYVRDDECYAEYVKLSNRYCKRAGLSAITVWDNLTENQREIFGKYATDLEGITVQLFTDDRESITSEANGLPIKQMTPCYTCTIEHWMNVLTREFKSWDGNSPKFIACQIAVWNQIKPNDIPVIEERMKEMTGGRFEFVRADVFFKLMREAKK